MKKPKNPCYGCLNRKVGCHAVCDLYIAFEKHNRVEYKDRAIKSSLKSESKDSSKCALLKRKLKN